MMGDFCEEVLRHPFYQTLLDEFERSCCQQLLATKKEDTAAREATWAEFNGARAFMTHMANFVDQAKKIREAREAQQMQDEGIDEETQALLYGDQKLSFGEADYEEF